jgi:hypothetical protein
LNACLFLKTGTVWSFTTPTFTKNSHFTISPTKFEAALLLFHQKRRIGEQVTELKARQNNFDPQSVLSLPRLLLNLKNLELHEYYSNHWATAPLTDTVSSDLAGWNKLQGISARTQTPLIPYMLASSTFANLTKIMTFFRFGDSPNRIHQKEAMTRSFLQNFKNAPALQYLHL